MGKSKKKNKINTNFGFSSGFEEQIAEGRVAKSKKRQHEKIRLRADEDEEYIDAKTSQRILKAVQKQRAELAQEFGPTPGEASSRGLYDIKKSVTQDSDSDSDVGPADDDKDEYSQQDFFDDLKMNEDDERALEMFQNKYVCNIIILTA